LGPGVMKGYYNKADETAEVIDAEGWFKTGDQGRLSKDGFLSITGRIKEMLIIGGENVFPSEIENALIQHPAVDEAAVIGIPDESRGEVPMAFVILNEGQSADEKELRSHCRDRLASLKVPRQVKICDDLPRGPTGKILKSRRARDLPPPPPGRLRDRARDLSPMADEHNTPRHHHEFRGDDRRHGGESFR
ncbi:MAG: hypothetical protein V3U34_04265, partial [candidate division NC10 bacterium]